MAVMFEFSVISQCVGPQTCVVAMVATTGIGDFTIASFLIMSGICQILADIPAVAK